MGILIPILGIMTGIIAIICSTYLKFQKMKIENLGSGEKQMLLEKINKLETENQELKERVENVETIVGGIDLDLLKIGSSTYTK
jgi:hypothetical protein